MISKPKKILILASMRSGSSFLLTQLCNGLSNVYNLAEFFNRSKFHIDKHLEDIKKYIKQNKIEKLYLYKDFLENVSSMQYNPAYLDIGVINHRHLSVKLDELADKYEYVCMKLLYGQSKEINKIIEMVDFVIFLNRKDVLAQFISLNKAHKTGLWNVNRNTLKKNPTILNNNQEVKILWNKEYFISYAETHKNILKEYLEIYKQCTKPKIWLSYEDIVNQSTDELYKLLYETIGIKLETNHRKLRTTLKQSKDNMQIEDNFINKEDFLKDSLSIQKYISYE
jgi:LPS sulfotransferase NodH